MGQVPAFLGNKEDYMASLIGSIVCLITLCAYCIFQVGADLATDTACCTPDNGWERKIRHQGSASVRDERRGCK